MVVAVIRCRSLEGAVKKKTMVLKCSELGSEVNYKVTSGEKKITIKKYEDFSLLCYNMWLLALSEARKKSQLGDSLWAWLSNLVAFQ